MNALNRLTTRIFDVLLTPFELLGPELSLVLVSGLFGILSLVAFKHISWQGGIKRAKDRIKGDMIAIRLYQDDLAIVGQSVVKVFLRNFQYLGLNVLPIVPLMAPFTLVAAQLVVRYGFDPIPVQGNIAEDYLPGRGVIIEIQLKKGREAEIRDLRLRLPVGLKAMSELVRNEVDGVAFVEVVATQAGEWEIELEFADGRRDIKRIVTGDRPSRVMQPERVSGFWLAWLFPAESTFPGNSPLQRVAFEYPERDLHLLPDGPVSIIVVFLVSAMAFGVLVLKPLGIQI